MCENRQSVGVSQEVQIKVADDVTVLVTSRDFCEDISEFFHEVGQAMIWREINDAYYYIFTLGAEISTNNDSMTPASETLQSEQI